MHRRTFFLGGAIAALSAAAASVSCGSSFSAGNGGAGGSSATDMSTSTHNGPTSPASSTSTGGQPGAGGAGGMGGGSVATSAPSASSGMGGSLMAASSSGAGMTGCGGACPTGKYCDTMGTGGSCVSCLNFTDLNFNAPAELAINGPGTSWGYARENPQATALQYTYKETSDLSELAITTNGAAPNWLNGTPVVLAANPGSNTGAFPIPPSSNFQSIIGGNLNKNQVWTLFTNYNSVTNTYSVEIVDEGNTSQPFDLVNAAGQNLDPAVAYELSPPRVYWMRNMGTGFRLVTQLADGSDAVANVDFDDPMNNCTLAALGTYAPWISPDGTLLMVMGFYDGSSCNVPTDVPHLFYVRMDATMGMPKGPPKRVFPADDSPMAAPALSWDKCGLYFSAMQQVDGGSVASIYYAARK